MSAPAVWSRLSEKERWVTLKTMQIYGGSFANRLATTWGHADAHNSAKLGNCFPELIVQYGPGTAFYNAVLEEV